MADGGIETTIPAADGRPLAATRFEPAGPVRAGVVVASANAVPRRLYTGFAEHLAKAGLEVLCFDYRGIGGSRRGSLRNEDARLHEWGTLDIEGAITWLGERHPDRPLLLVGHSVAGQVLGLAPSAPRLEGVFLVASQSGWWRLWPGLHKAWIAFLWYGLIPVLTPLLGYFPLPWFTGGGEPMPAGAAREWARWGRHRRYVLSWRGPELHARLACPLRLVAVEGDLFAPERACRELLGFYPNADSELVTVGPEDLDGRSIGHFDFFRRRFREPLWDGARDWLLARAGEAEDR